MGAQTTCQTVWAAVTLVSVIYVVIRCKMKTSPTDNYTRFLKLYNGHVNSDTNTVEALLATTIVLQATSSTFT